MTTVAAAGAPIQNNFEDFMTRTILSSREVLRKEGIKDLVDVAAVFRRHEEAEGKKVEAPRVQP